jgi:microcystin-dependent protein
MEGFFIGHIMAFASNFAPSGWAFCQGQLLSIAQNTALFSILGTTYGGNGQTTFGLPDFRGRVPIGAGQGPGLPNYQLGEMGGTTTVALTTSNMPSHTHTATVSVGVSDSIASLDEPIGAILSTGNSPLYNTVAQANGTMAPGTLTLATAGASTPIDLYKPYLGINYVICLQGIFPSRN